MTDPIGRAYDAVVAPYAERFAGELAHKPLDRALLEVIVEEARGGVIADLGCGPGHVAALLAARGARTFGLDLSVGMVEQARALHPGVEYRQGDLRALEVPSGSLAGVVALYAIVHFTADELPAVFAELCRVVAPGGPLLLSFHLGETPIHVTELFGVPVELTFQLFPMATVTGALERAGFAVEARLERAAYAAVEHPTTRAYVLARRPGG